MLISRILSINNNVYSFKAPSTQLSTSPRRWCHFSRVWVLLLPRAGQQSAVGYQCNDSHHNMTLSSASRQIIRIVHTITCTAWSFNLWTLTIRWYVSSFIGSIDSVSSSLQPTEDGGISISFNCHHLTRRDFTLASYETLTHRVGSLTMISRHLYWYSLTDRHKYHWLSNIYIDSGS